MAKRKVRLAVWVHYDSEDGYVWPQVYATEKDAYLHPANLPHKAMMLLSEPYEFDDSRRTSGSFGTEVPVIESATQDEQIICSHRWDPEATDYCLNGCGTRAVRTESGQIHTSYCKTMKGGMGHACEDAEPAQQVHQPMTGHCDKHPSHNNSCRWCRERDAYQLAHGSKAHEDTDK